MIKYRQEIKKIPDEIICDVCKVSENADSNASIIHIDFDCGYGENLFGDGTKIEFDICTNCLNSAFPTQIRSKQTF